MFQNEEMLAQPWYLWNFTVDDEVIDMQPANLRELVKEKMYYNVLGKLQAIDDAVGSISGLEDCLVFDLTKIHISWMQVTEAGGVYTVTISNDDIDADNSGGKQAKLKAAAKH